MTINHMKSIVILWTPLKSSMEHIFIKVYVTFLRLSYFFWIFLDTTDEQFGGLKDAIMMATMILGLPILETRTKPETATIGTSIASKYLRDILNVELPHRLPTITLASFKYRKPMYTFCIRDNHTCCRCCNDKLQNAITL